MLLSWRIRRISSFFWFSLLSLTISKYRQYFLMLQTLKLNNEKWKNIFVLRRKKFGRIDTRRKHSKCMYTPLCTITHAGNYGPSFTWNLKLPNLIIGTFVLRISYEWKLQHNFIINAKKNSQRKKFNPDSWEAIRFLNCFLNLDLK